eukprot:TRINITY_DN15568_c0_g1_i3.p1 TRINITY_DN15568_c0_g1~~TRINITY_DN15568_c0_g1_i3.p1  ORF type:complete len:499 (-),score=101.47 TRINITY_DN15568_c0_g1_i3:1384-2880(-)
MPIGDYCYAVLSTAAKEIRAESQSSRETRMAYKEAIKKCVTHRGDLIQFASEDVGGETEDAQALAQTTIAKAAKGQKKEQKKDRNGEMVEVTEGDLTLHVRSTEGFGGGDQIRVGDCPYTISNIDSPTSITLTAQLQQDHREETSVVVTKAAELTWLQVVRAALANDITAVHYVPDTIGQYKKQVALYAAVEAIHLLTDKWRRDKEVALAAVVKVQNLQHIPEESEAYAEVVDAAINKSASALQFVSETLRKTWKVAELAVNKDGMTLKYVPESNQSYKEVVLAAVRQNGQALKFASDRLRRTKEVAEAAVSKDGSSLQHVPDDCDQIEEVVRAAIRKRRDAFNFASEQLRDTEEVVLAAVKENPAALESASSNLLRAKKVAMKAVEIDGLVLKYVPDSNVAYEEVVKAAIKQNGQALEHAAEPFQDMDEVVLAAVVNPDWGHDQYRRLFDLHDDTCALECAVSVLHELFFCHGLYGPSGVAVRCCRGVQTGAQDAND